MARYTPAILEQIKLRLNLVDEVRRVVPDLKKKGKYWWAPCPFHSEKSPSFHVRDEGNYYCFGCGAHGDIFTFVMETRGGTFMDVVKELAARAGVALPVDDTPPDPKARGRKEEGLKALARAAVFFQRNLGHEAVEPYLAKRGLGPATLETFELGYSPDAWTETRDALLSEGFTPEALRDTGLALESTKGKGDYDRFRGRLMFPIHNLRGEVVGFGGRVLGAGEPKYLNSPETMFFSKSNLLFNLHRAREAIKKSGQALLVEGYMDVIGLWQAGIKTALAPMGTSVTPEQISLLWHHAAAPIICLDGDSAGRSAALRVAQKALPLLEPGKTLSFVFLPDGEDPDSLIKKDGPTAFHRLISTPTSLEDVLWQHASQGQDVKTANGRAVVEGNVNALLSDIKNSTVKRAYSQVLRDKIFAASRGAGSFKGKKAGGPLGQGSTTSTTDYRPAVLGDSSAMLLLALGCRYPEVLATYGEALAGLSFPTGSLADVHTALVRTISRGGNVDDIRDQFSDVLSDLERATGLESLTAERSPQDVCVEALQTYHQRRTQAAAKSLLKQKPAFTMEYFSGLQKASKQGRETP